MELQSARTSTVSRVAAVAGMAVAFVWAIIRAGATVSPGLDDAHKAALIWPRIPGGEFSSFYADSSWGILIFRMLQLESEREFLLLAVLSAVFAVLALAAWAAWAVPTSLKSRAVRLMLLAPLPAVLFNWLGFYDGYTVLAWAVVLWAWASGSRVLLAISGVFLGLQHFEQGLLGIIGITLVWFATREHLRAPLKMLAPTWSLLGLIAGKAILMTTLALNGSELTGRTSGVSAYYREWIVTAMNTGPILLWSLFAGSWAILIAWWLRESRVRNHLLLAVALATAAGAMLLSGDRPRVFIMITAPLLLLLTVALLSQRSLSRKTWLGIETVVWIGPPVALWGPVVVNANVLDHLIMTFRALAG